MTIISCIGFIFPTFQGTYGFSRDAFIDGDYTRLVLQVVLFQFLHANFLHLFMNSYFLISAGPTLEARMSENRFLSFFIGSSIFIAIALFFFAPFTVTIGISGFCMALLSYLWMDLQRIRHPMANQVLIMLAINIGIGLVPGISLVGHAAGAVWGLLWWWGFRTWKK